MLRIGQGYDVHRLTPNRKLVLCGVEIAHDKGLLGHSDADVAVHAVIDALLGALALGDIGKWFPDSDNAYKDADSMQLLQMVLNSDTFKNQLLGNLDLTIIAQEPKLAGYIQQMRLNLSSAFQCQLDRISVKATTTEQLGFAGRGEGIAASAVLTLLQA